MNRRKRIRIVVVSAIGLTSLLVAFLGPLTAAVALQRPLGMSADEGQMMESVQEAVRVTMIVNLASLVALGVAGICFVYLMVVLAAWFIGPAQQNQQADA